MTRISGIFFFLCLYSGAVYAQTTLEECQQQARENYPLIKQYGLIAKSTDYSIANARRAWIPQVSLSAQASYQSDVTAFPEEMQAIYQNMGIYMQGLNKDQYKVALEVNQPVWDGGSSRAQRIAAETEGSTRQAEISVDIYAVRERVNSLFFGILTLDAQAKQNDLLQNLLGNNMAQIKAYVDNGIALQSDLDAIEVELLSARQQRTQINASREAYRNMLSILTGHPAGVLQEPAEIRVNASDIRRPELLYMEKQNEQLDAQGYAVRASVQPRIGAFAQGFYGSPGLNMFKDMIENKWSWNYIVGIKFQWTLGAYYNKKNNLSKIALARQEVDNQRETFLFNTRLQTTEQQLAIDKMREVMAQDERIITLRESVRKSYEAKLANGIIQVNDLLREITAENQARIAEVSHRIEWLKNMYDLKYTTNN